MTIMGSVRREQKTDNEGTIRITGEDGSRVFPESSEDLSSASLIAADEDSKRALSVITLLYHQHTSMPKEDCDLGQQ